MGDHLAKICMLADSHGLYDDRIYWKEAVSLSNAGYSVHLVIAGETNDHGVTAEGITYDVVRRDRFPASPLLNYLGKRLPGGLYREMFRRAAAIRADVYHIHDLKVNTIGEKLRRLQHSPELVYDVHEPYPENILDYWPRQGFKALLRKPWSARVKRWERSAVKNYNLIIVTEENMRERFKSFFPAKPVEIIYNFTNLPPADEGPAATIKEYDAIYTGGITTWRGAWQILEAVIIAKDTRPSIKVLFLGSWFPPDLREEMSRFIVKHDLQDNIVLKDAVPYQDVADYYRKSRIGLGIFLPILTHRIILQIKIFEYMNYGLPILGSNFGHIAGIMEKHGCGLAVDPANPEAIARGLLELLSDEKAYASMSNNGRIAVEDHYRWDRMEEKLLELYRDLTGGRG